ncbi:MAG: Dipeptide transport system permease protein DppC, partial [uncultured Ramlibacter sp.]
EKDLRALVRQRHRLQLPHLSGGVRGREHCPP